MCGRVDKPSSQEVLDGLKKQSPIEFEVAEEFEANPNVPPTLALPVLTSAQPHLMKHMYWGLVPSFAPEFKMTYSTFNATVENLFQGNTWKRLIGKKHCVVMVKGFYEWQYDDPKTKKGGKHIYRIQTADSPLTFMAGLYEDWVDRSTGEVKQSCTIITNPANAVMAKIHNTKARMPAFLASDHFLEWLNPSIAMEERMELIQPVDNAFIAAHEIAQI